MTMDHSPDAVEDASVWEDADVDIGHDDVVKVSLSLVGEEQVGHPHFVGIRQRQILDFACKADGSTLSERPVVKCHG
jgi:hypothetical protein